MSGISISALPITIISVCESVDLDIGGIPAAIIEPKGWLFKQGAVYLCTRDFINGNWEKLLTCTIGLNKYPGVTKDHRLLNIAEKILYGRTAELIPGTILPTEK